ncbi:hypothetical protein Tco_0789495 [Tanacetum coccineum]
MKVYVMCFKSKNITWKEKEKIFIMVIMNIFSKGVGIKKLHDDLGVNIANCFGFIQITLKYFYDEEMDLETAQTTTTAKLPILKQGEYDMWRLRIEQYFQVQDYALWDVIKNGNSFKPAAQTTTNVDGFRRFTASTQVSTTNLSDATVYAFLAIQPNMSQLVYEDLEQIHEDDLEEMDLKWQLALLSMRTEGYHGVLLVPSFETAGLGPEMDYLSPSYDLLNKGPFFTRSWASRNKMARSSILGPASGRFDIKIEF